MNEKTEYSPMDNSVEAINYRYNKRRKHVKTTEGQVVSEARYAERSTRREEREAAIEEENAPDEIEKSQTPLQAILGTFSIKKRWKKK